jgi:hypothetical protein
MKSLIVIEKLLFQPAWKIISFLSMLFLLTGCGTTAGSTTSVTTSLSPSEAHPVTMKKSNIVLWLERPQAGQHPNMPGRACF